MGETEPDIQSLYPDHFALCYGCGRLNERGYQLKTRLDGDETVTRFTPAHYHTAISGFVYGGLLASVIDCHSTATGAAALYRAEGRRLDDGGPAHRCVTGTLAVRFRRPTPLGPELVVRGRVTSVEGRRVSVASRVEIGGDVVVEGEAVVIEVPEGFGAAAELT
ncbi:MAG: PaaI family thioesterase [Acidimicrobiales bacterium]